MFETLGQYPQLNENGLYSYQKEYADQSTEEIYNSYRFSKNSIHQQLIVQNLAKPTDIRQARNQDTLARNSKIENSLEFTMKAKESIHKDNSDDPLENSIYDF